MTEGPQGVEAQPYKSRRGWLIGFGSVEILIAAVFLLLVGLLLFLPLPPTVRNPAQAGAGFPVKVKVAGGVVYGFLAAIFIIIGIGSILCKNWGRIASIVVSAFWLGAGVIGTAFDLWLWPRVMRQQGIRQGEAGHVVFVVMAVFMGFFVVVLPAVFLLFYSRKSVRATCLFRGLPSGSAATLAARPFSPLPVPLIILAVWEAFGVLGLFGLLFARATIVFGVVVHGSTAVLVILLYAIVSGLAAWLILRRRVTGWAIALFKSLYSFGSAVAMLAGHRTLIEIAREVGLGEPPLRIYQQILGVERVLWFWSLAFAIAAVIFVLYTKKFFPRTGAASAPLAG